jgi:hypothetical protein
MCYIEAVNRDRFMGIREDLFQKFITVRKQLDSTFRLNSGNIQGTCREHAGNMQGFFQQICVTLRWSIRDRFMGIREDLF